MKNLYGFSIVNCRAMCIDLVWVGQTAWKKGSYRMQKPLLCSRIIKGNEPFVTFCSYTSF